MGQSKIGNWRYGAIQRQFREFDGTITTQVVLGEVYSNDAYTIGNVTVAVDELGDAGKKELAKWLRLAADDVEKYDLIIDPDVVKYGE